MSAENNLINGLKESEPSAVQFAKEIDTTLKKYDSDTNGFDTSTTLDIVNNDILIMVGNILSKNGSSIFSYEDQIHILKTLHPLDLDGKKVYFYGILKAADFKI